MIYNYYLNAIELIKYREMTLEDKPLSKEDAVNEYKKLNYIQINCSNEKRDERCGVFICNSDDMFSKKPNFTKFINNQSKEFNNIVLFVETPKKMHDDFKGGDPYIEVYPQTKIVTNVPQHKYVSKHELISAEDFPLEFNETEERRFHFSEELIPIITADDTMNVWVGGRRGEYVKIYNKSQIVGESIKYRIIS